MKTHSSFVGRLIPLLLYPALWAGAAGAQEYSYQYVSLDEASFPEGVLFFDPTALTNGGRVVGTAFTCVTPECEIALPRIAVYENGAVTIGETGLALAVNEGGTIGGSVLVDPDNFIEQAALFHGDRVELVPRLPGEFTSFVTALSDSGSALVTSFNDSFEVTYVLYKNGESTVLDFGAELANISQLAINNADVVAGTQGENLCDGSTGFRFDTRSGALELLEPLTTEPAGWGLEINNRGNVLGYSFACGGLERIGVWDRHGAFRPYFVEGTEEFPTISNDLLFNDNNLIVITAISSPDEEALRNSYLVPRPGVRLNLADLVPDLPEGVSLSSIRDINDRGSMIGVDFLTGGSFLLERR